MEHEARKVSSGLYSLSEGLLQELLSFLQHKSSQSDAPLKVVGHLEVQLANAYGRELCPGTFQVDRWPDPQIVAYIEEPIKEGGTASCSWYTADAGLLCTLLMDTPLCQHSFWLSDSQPSQVTVLRTLGLVKEDYQHHTYCFSGGIDDLPDTSLPLADAKLAPLTTAAAEVVTQHWKYGRNNTSYVQRIIAFGLPTVGVYLLATSPLITSSSPSDDGLKSSIDSDAMRPSLATGSTDSLQRGELIAWALTQPYLAMGTVHVLERYRGKGLGKAVIRALAYEQLKRGWRPYAYVEPGNVASQRMFEALGFQDVASRGWTLCSSRLVHQVR